MYKNIKKIIAVNREDLKTGCMINYLYFKENYKMIAIDLSKQQVLDKDSKAIHQIYFTNNIDLDGGGGYIFFIIREVKQTILYFPHVSVKYYNSVFQIIFDIVKCYIK